MGSLAFVAVGLVLCLQPALSIRFVIDHEECLSQKFPYAGDRAQLSYVVIKYDKASSSPDVGVDFVVKDPSGDKVYFSRGKTMEKIEFETKKSGLYRFCFTNRSPYHETIDFDVHLNHIPEEHAKDEHFGPLLGQIAKLEAALEDVAFEQHWLEAQTDRQALVIESISRRATYKALFEAAALIGTCLLQIFLLKRLLKRKVGDPWG